MPVSADLLWRTLDSIQPEVKEVLAPFLIAQAAAGVCSDSESGALFVGSRESKGLGGFDFIVFPSCSEELIKSYCGSLNVSLPRTCLEYLSQFNGGNFFGLYLYGLDERVAFPSSSNNVSLWRPHDLCAERLILKRMSRLSHGRDGHFTFASRPSAPEEVLSYALEYPTFAKVIAISRKGQVVASWDTFIEFLASELKAAAAFDPEWCAGMSAIIASIPPGKRRAG